MLELIEAEDAASRRTHECLLHTRRRRDDFETSAREELLREFEEPNSRFLVALEQNEIVGYARAAILEQPDPFFKTTRVGYVHALCTRAPHRGQGIASRLYEEVESWLTTEGCRQIHLEVFDGNEATKIYEGWGYTRFLSKNGERTLILLLF